MVSDQHSAAAGWCGKCSIRLKIFPHACNRSLFLLGFNSSNIGAPVNDINFEQATSFLRGFQSSTPIAKMTTTSHSAPKLPPPRVLLAATCVLQFLVWFKPSEQYFVNVVPRWFDITVQDVTHTLFMHSLYAPFVTFPLLFVVYRFGGYSSALLLTTIAAAATPALVVFGAPHLLAVIFSQWTWALHFGALFVTIGMLYSFLPPSWYMQAAAANTATMLTASTISSAVGLAMVRLPHGGSHSELLQMDRTFTVSLASNFAGFLWLLLCMARGWIPIPYTPACETMRRKAAALVGDPPPRDGSSPTAFATSGLDPQEDSAMEPLQDANHPAFSSAVWSTSPNIALTVQPNVQPVSSEGIQEGASAPAATPLTPPCAAAPATHALLTVPRIWRWVVPAFMVRGVHTLVIEIWPALSADGFPQLQAWNAAIGLGAYIAAAVAVLLAGKVLSLRSARVAQYVVVASILLSAAFLLAIDGLVPSTPQHQNSSDSMVVMGVLIAAYNLTAEIALAVSSAQTAREVFRILAAAGYVPAATEASAPQARDDLNDRENTQPTPDAGFSVTSTVLGALGGGQWAFVLGVQALLAEGWQLVVQFTLWPHGVWPLSSNPYGLHLSLSQQFFGFGLFAVLAGVLSLVLHGVPLELLAHVSGGCFCRCKHKHGYKEESHSPISEHLLQDSLAGAPSKKHTHRAARRELIQDALCPALWRSWAT